METVKQLFAEQPYWAQALIGLLALAIAALTVNFLIKKVILRAAAPYLDEKSDRIDKAAAWLATVAPLLVISNGIELVPHLYESVHDVIANVTQALIVLSVAMAVVRALGYANEVYERQPQARNRPIKGYIQLVKLLVLMGAAVILISVLLDQSPFLLLSGLGAVTAVLLLVFKDTILSLVASVQLTSNDMLRVGDWITMPSMETDGDVVDISLHTIKVQNFDKTITTIPTHRMVSDAFQNWRGMQDSGGRRIKRAVHIDQNSIRFLSEDEVSDCERFVLLRPYLKAKRAEIAEWNAIELPDGEAPVNARRMTNIGMLRAYATAYMTHHPKVRETGFTLMVRQLEPGPDGLPLQLYCFAATTNWPKYEAIQADIFDHVLAIIPEFDLRVFQQPSGLDFAQGLSRS